MAMYWMYVCMNVYFYLCIYVSMYVYMYVCRNVFKECIYVYM